MGERSALLAVVVTMVGCITPHENFAQMMNAQVGKSVDDPSFLGNRYQQFRAGSKRLPNGNTEEELRPARACRVFFEIDETSKKIAAWRWEGREEHCAIPI